MAMPIEMANVIRFMGFSRLLTADVDGHQSLIYSRCAFAAVARFLADPRSVATTTLCQN
jgi:hypothetical protein